MTKDNSFLAELRWRGLVQQVTHEEHLVNHTQAGQPRVAYIGFDPTADSLTIGNLVSIKLLMHWQRAGHTPIAVVGGGTGLIGDPSGKSAERNLLTPEQVALNVAGQRRIFERMLDFSPGLGNRAVLLDNLEWLGELSYIEALRDIGKHFSVNMMIQKDSVRERLHNRDQGISYTEFSYMLLQAYDFLHLHRTHGVSLQMGGSDQWGNIVAGCDLIRRVTQVADREVYGLTSPLVTKADGGKFGKSESGAVWLTADRTSPYAFYQFWLNSGDDDVPRFLRIFSMLGEQEVAELTAAHQQDPGSRAAHRALARHMTELLHGPAARAEAEAAAQALFSGEIAELPLSILEEVLAAAPSRAGCDRGLIDGEGLPLVDVLTGYTDLAKSKREAREFLSNGSVQLNGRRVGLEDRLRAEHLLHGRIAAFRRGKKAWFVTRWG